MGSLAFEYPRRIVSPVRLLYRLPSEREGKSHEVYFGPDDNESIGHSSNRVHLPNQSTSRCQSSLEARMSFVIAIIPTSPTNHNKPWSVMGWI